MRLSFAPGEAFQFDWSKIFVATGPSRRRTNEHPSTRTLIEAGAKRYNLDPTHLSAMRLDRKGTASNAMMPNTKAKTFVALHTIPSQSIAEPAKLH